MVYEFLIGGHLGDRMLAAFPSLEADWLGKDTLLRGRVQDRSALFGIIAQVEAFGLELLEIRRAQDA